MKKYYIVVETQAPYILKKYSIIVVLEKINRGSFRKY